MNHNEGPSGRSEISAIENPPIPTNGHFQDETLFNLSRTWVSLGEIDNAMINTLTPTTIAREQYGYLLVWQFADGCEPWGNHPDVLISAPDDVEISEEVLSSAYERLISCRLIAAALQGNREEMLTLLNRVKPDSLDEEIEQSPLGVVEEDPLRALVRRYRFWDLADNEDGEADNDDGEDAEDDQSATAEPTEAELRHTTPDMRWVTHRWRTDPASSPPDAVIHVINYPFPNTTIPLIREACRQQDVSCGICLADYEVDDSMAVLPCDSLHRFHYMCVFEWFSAALKSENGRILCPYCREAFAIERRLWFAY